jgi:probable addiction module antidote protein
VKKIEIFSPFSIAEQLKTKEDIAVFLEVLLPEGTPEEIANGFGHIAKANGLKQILREADMPLESLQFLLSDDGRSMFITMLKLSHALGVKLVLADKS